MAHARHPRQTVPRQSTLGSITRMVGDAFALAGSSDDISDGLEPLETCARFRREAKDAAGEIQRSPGGVVLGAVVL